MFYNYGQIGFDGLLLFGAFVFAGIYGYTTLMDGKPHAAWIESGRALAGLALLLGTGDWFGLGAYWAQGPWWVGLYFAITLFAGIYFRYMEKGAEQSPLAY
jgi:hypothetical protein